MSSSVSNQPVSSESNGSDCSICVDSLYDNKEKVVGKCAHVFHKACIEGWKKNNCPQCRQDWVVITKATDFQDLIRGVMNYHLNEMAKKEKQLERKRKELAEQESTVSALKKRIQEMENQAPKFAKAVLGEQLNVLSLKTLTTKIADCGRLSGNLQTFTRELFKEEPEEEIDRFWYHFRKIKKDDDMVDQILQHYAKRPYNSIEQLKAVCIRCGIYNWQIDKIIEEAKKAK